MNAIQILKGHQVLWMLLDVLLSFNNLWKSTACVTQSFLEMGTVKHSIWLQRKIAITNNAHSVKGMQDAIWAIWYHMQSTDENPDRSRCPVGEDSCCGFQRDVAKKTLTYTRKNPLPKAVATAIYPVFEALAAEELLSGCLHGGMQNQNEAFNALIWQRATKETHSSLPTMQLATLSGSESVQ